MRRLLPAGLLFFVFVPCSAATDLGLTVREYLHARSITLQRGAAPGDICFDGANVWRAGGTNASAGIPGQPDSAVYGSDPQSFWEMISDLHERTNK